MIRHAAGRRIASEKRRWFACLLALAAVFGLVATVHAIVVNGNIHPLAIEVDGNDSLASPNNNTANLYPNPLGSNPAMDDNNVACPSGFVNGPIKNSGATTDWVKDCKTNSDPISVINSIAMGIDPTGASNPDGIKTGAVPLGHWNGARVVDGFGGADKDIFLKGGKINDLTTWTIGPGSLGSAKYDITQAYLASNKDTLFVGMERSGNNGSTAFDLEFNQLPPLNAYVPNRSMGDVLLTFEMQGSGSSGSATPHYFVWNGSTYVEQPVPAGVKTSINNSPTPAAPWGTVNSSGAWVTTDIPRFQFAEAAIPRMIFGNVNPCGGGHAFVGLHTRSSSSGTSDMKDITRIFEYKFGGPDAQATFATTCSAEFTYDGTSSRDSFNESNLTWDWSFLPPAGVTLSGMGLTGPDGNGVYHSSSPAGTVKVTFGGAASAAIAAALTVTEIGTTCTDSKAQVLELAPGLEVDAALTQKCGHQFGYSASATGGDGNFVYAWTFQKQNGGDWTTVGTSALPAGTFDAPSGGIYRALLLVTSGGCTATPAVVGSPVTVYDEVAATAALTTNCAGTFDYAGSASGGKAPHTFHWDFSVSPATATLSGGGVSGGSGTYSCDSEDGTGVQVTFPGGVSSATITATVTVKDANNCTVVSDPQVVTVYPALDVSGTLTAQCGTTIGYSSTVTGGSGTHTYAWQFQKNSQENGSGTWSDVSTRTDGSGTLSVPTAGRYRAMLTVTSGSCTTDPAVTSNEINVYDAVGGSILLTPDCDSTFLYSATATGGKPGYTFEWTIEKLVEGNWVTAHTFADTPAGDTSSGGLDADSFSPGGDGQYRALVKISDSQGLNPACSTTLTSDAIEVRQQLTVTAAKMGADGMALSVTLHGTVSDSNGVSLQWQRWNGSAWVAATGSGATTDTLTYSSFEADSVPTSTSFSIGEESFAGQLWTVQLRLHAERTVNGTLCEANSEPVTVNLVKGVGQ